MGAHLERLFGLCGTHSPKLDERPKGRIVQVVDVAWYVSVSSQSNM